MRAGLPLPGGRAQHVHDDRSADHDDQLDDGDPRGADDHEQLDPVAADHDDHQLDPIAADHDDHAAQLW